MQSRRDHIYQRFPDPVIGYELNPEHGYFSVIIPEATTNLVLNPSVEPGTTGYTTFGGAMARVATWQAFGAYGLQLTPAVSTESGFYYGTISLTAGTTYTASVVIQGEAGKTYYIWFATTAGALLGTKRKWIGTGHKQRIWVTYTETSSTTRRVYVTRDAQYPDQNLFYADGLQVEAKSYPTTYCDGDQVGFVLGQAAYYWNGTYHASTSTRSAQTRAGGREMNLLDYGLRILAVLGLGLAPLVDQALPMPGRGEMAQGTGTIAREFTLVSALYGAGKDGRHLQAQRDDLVDAFKPDLTAFEQPLILRYQGCDEDGEPNSDSVDLICKYISGLEGNWDNHQQERLGLNFKMHLPLIKSTYENGSSLGYSSAIANANYLVYRDATGQWNNISASLNGSIYAITKTTDELIWVAGAFTNLGGAGNDRLAYWDGATLTGMAGITGGNIYALAAAPNGDLYIGGDFTAIGGDGTMARVARWDGAAWNSVGGGIGNGVVYALAVDDNGYLFIGGTFVNVGDANGDRITMWDGAAFISIGPADNAVSAITVNQANGHIYIGGQFDTFALYISYGIVDYYFLPNGIATLNLIGRTFFTSTTVVQAITIAPNGNVIIGGTLGVSGLSGTYHAAEYNGNTWTLLSTKPMVSLASIRAAYYYQNKIYLGGNFDDIGDLPLTLGDHLALYDGSNWLPLDINLPGAPIVYALFADNNRLFIGYDTAGIAYGTLTTVTNNGSSIAYPIFAFTGPGIIWQAKNYTTGKSIFFDLTLLDGEYAFLNLDPQNISFTSTFRGNILNTILPGSNLNFELLPGQNNISAYIFGNTTAATQVLVKWRNQYWSLDGAVWK